MGLNVWILLGGHGPNLDNGCPGSFEIVSTTGLDFGAFDLMGCVDLDPLGNHDLHRTLQDCIGIRLETMACGTGARETVEGLSHGRDT
jgi:hypothetical protein